MTKYKKALLAIDISSEAKEIIAQAREFTTALNCELNIVHICEAIPLAFGEYISVIDMEQVLVDTKKAVSDLVDGSVDEQHIYVEQGYPAKSIVELAAKLNIDLIVMGRHSHSSLERLLIGSVTNTVLSHTTCDVLTLKTE